MFVGGSASVIRAAIMGSIGLFAMHNGRLPHARLAVLWTAFFMLLWNPLQLWYDAGFQLSFLAVIGLIELQPILNEWGKRIPEFGGIREALLTTIAAQCTTTPWSAYVFGQFSIIAPLANILTTPLIPMAMLFGFLGSVIGWPIPILGQLIGFPAFLLLTFIIRTTEILAHIPFASAHIEHVSAWIVAGYYVGLVGFVRFLHPRSSVRNGLAAPSSIGGRGRPALERSD
jgi:competence protein ComEC